MDEPKSFGGEPFKVLYIDDDVEKIAFITRILTPEAIAEFVADNPDVLSDSAVELLKKVQLTPVHNNPTKDQIVSDPTLTPAGIAAREIYNGKYNVVITDMNMPADDENNNVRYKKVGGLFIINVARIAGVPVITHSSNSRDEIIQNVNETSPDVLAYGVAPSEARKAFSQSLTTARKGNQESMYLALSHELEKLTQPPQLEVA